MTWVPPIGIPAPDFGIEEVAGVATQTITGGGALPATLVLSPGDIVEISAESYTGVVAVSGGGSAEAPCYIRGASAAARPLIAGRFSVTNGTYLIFEHLHFADVTEANCIQFTGAGASHHLAVRQCRFTDITWPGSGGCHAVSIYPSQNGIMSDVVVWDNYFYNIGNQQATWDTLDTDCMCCSPATFGRTPPTELSRVWFVDNHCELTSGSAYLSNGGSEAMIPKLHHLYIGRNVGISGRQGPFWTKQSSHVIFSQNRVRASRPHAGGGSSGEAFGIQYGPEYVWWLFNEIDDCCGGIKQSDTGADALGRHVYAIGNVAHDFVQIPDNETTFWGRSQTGWFTMFFGGRHAWHVIDNTIYNYYQGPVIIFDGTEAEVYGNIFYNKLAPESAQPQGAVIDIDGAVAQGHATADYNLMFGGNGTHIRWGTGTNISYTSLAAWQAATTQMDHGIAADPLFVDLAAGNARLGIGSPAHAAHPRHAAYDTFFTLYGIDIAKDFEGRARPPSGAWDLGAYQGGDRRLRLRRPIAAGAF
jgi:hypothetical protein